MGYCINLPSESPTYMLIQVGSRARAAGVGMGAGAGVGVGRLFTGSGSESVNMPDTRHWISNDINRSSSLHADTDEMNRGVQVLISPSREIVTNAEPGQIN